MPLSIGTALSQEWLVSNGLGGYASGTVANCNTRRYHGLLVAALNPPLDRTLLLAKLDATLWVGATPYPLFANEFEDGTIDPDNRFLEAFEVQEGVPTWTYASNGWRLRAEVWMEPGANTTYVQYNLLEASSACRLEARILAGYTEFHAEQHVLEGFTVRSEPEGLRFEAFPGARPYWLTVDQPYGLDGEPGWCFHFAHRVERERGLDFTQDLYSPGYIAAALLPGKPVLFTASTEQPAISGPATVSKPAIRSAEPSGNPLVILGQPSRPTMRLASPNAGQVTAKLKLAAGQFLVTTPSRPATVIAGYHWFGDWGRDTMISLPGLALATGRTGLAKDILRTFVTYVDRGMIPNRFEEQGGAEYNNVDGTLWLFHAVDSYLRAAEDPGFLREVFPTLEGIVDWHLKGTRYNIKVDPADGLLAAGETGVQLTWMDAKVDGWVVTPRIGKPVEINALWFNAVCLMAAWARELQRPAEDYQQLASQIGRSFRARFWNPSTGCLYDVIDGPDGDDPSIRPNQVFAVSLPYAVLFGDHARSTLEVVERDLLTPYGLRSLSPADPRYRGRHEGNRWQRDSSYHQGTVWAWLIGPYVDAYLRVRKDKRKAIELLRPLIQHMDHDGGIGTISEVFDGDAPHAPRGCIAQAWSVAEVLRCWTALHAPPPPQTVPLLGGNHGSH